MYTSLPIHVCDLVIMSVITERVYIYLYVCDHIYMRAAYSRPSMYTYIYLTKLLVVCVMLSNWIVSRARLAT